MARLFSVKKYTSNNIFILKDSKSKEIKESEHKLNDRIFENSDVLTEYTELQRKKYNNIHDIDKWNKLIGIIFYCIKCWNYYIIA